MNRTILAVMLITSAPTACATARPQPLVAPPGSVVFTDVNVVPMTHDTVLHGMSVMVTDGQIRAVESAAALAIGDGVQVVNGAGMWLMPGLVDAHVHTLGAAVHTDRLMRVGLMQGVTSAVILSGDTMALGLRGRYAAGELGPTLYVAGPLVDDSVLTHEGGRALAASYHAAGYDLIKVYSQLSKDGFRGIMIGAQQLNIPVVGHVVRSVDLEGTLGAGVRGIVHLEEYLYSYFGFATSDTTRRGDDVLRREAIPYLASISASAGVYVTPTLVTYERMVALVDDLEDALATPGMEYLGDVLRGALRRHGAGNYAERFTHPQQVANLRAALNVQREMLREFHRAGVRLLTGTDAPIAVTLPGYGVHRELQILVEAGLTPFEALGAATRNAAAYLRDPSGFGTVEPGRRADLLLVRGNPLADVAAASDIAGVMVRGRWLDADEIQDLQAALR